MHFRFNRRSLFAAGSALALTVGLTATQAFAGSNNGNLSVSATVSTNCTISQGSALAFGSINDLTQSTNGTGTMDTVCTNSGVVSSFAIDHGQNNGHCATGFTRCMTDGSTHYLNYKIYEDSARGTEWPVATNVTTATLGASFASNTLTIYGTVPSQTVQPAASYSDTLSVTVNF